jgi:DNA-binding transcriptional LysR family regulator
LTAPGGTKPRRFIRRHRKPATALRAALALAVAAIFAAEIGCEQILHSGRLVELLPEWSDERFPLYAIHPSRFHRAAKVQAFIEFCLKIMGRTVPNVSAGRRGSGGRPPA